MNVFYLTQKVYAYRGSALEKMNPQSPLSKSLLQTSKIRDVVPNERVMEIVHARKKQHLKSPTLWRCTNRQMPPLRPPFAHSPVSIVHG